MSILFLFSGAQAQELQSLSLGDYETATAHFEGSVGQKAPFDFDHMYSRSQQLYTASELNGLSGKEITELRMRICTEDGNAYVPDYTVQLRLYLTNVEQEEFKMKEGEVHHRWLDIDREKDLYLTQTLVLDFIEIGTDNKELVFKLDKPFRYTGKTMLMTVEASANVPLSDTGSSFVDFFCYPKNVKGYPIRTLFAASDKKDVSQPEGYGVYADASGLKQRAVLKIFYRSGGGDTPTLDPIHPVVEVTTPGQLKTQLSAIANLAGCLSLTVKGQLDNTDIKFIHENLPNITKIDLSGASIVGDRLPDNAFSKHPALAEVFLPLNLMAIGTASLSDMPALTRVVMGNQVTEIFDNAFALSKALKDVVWSSKLMSIHSEAFKDCSSIEVLNLPESVAEIGQSAFYGCTGLKHFNSPAALTKIDRLVFFGCSSMTEVVLTEKVEQLMLKSFGNCKALQKFTVLRATPPAIHAQTFSGVAVKNVSLFVPDSKAVEAYKKANFWKNFTNILPVENSQPTFTLTFVSDYEGGMIKAYLGTELLSSGVVLKKDSSIRFVAEPKDGYLLKNWIVGDQNIPAEGLEYTHLLTRNIQVQAVFEKEPVMWEVNFRANDDKMGRVTASINGMEIATGTKHKPDQTVVFKAHPADKYHLKHWLINGQVVAKEGQTKEVVLSRNTLVEAVFERDEIFYQVSISIQSNDGGVDATANGLTIPLNSKVKEGATLVVTATPADKYEFDAWTVNGRRLEDQTEPVLTLTVDQNYRIEASFKLSGALEGVATSDVRVATEQGAVIIDGLSEQAPLHIYEASGRCVVSTFVSSSSLRLALPSGSYIVQLGQETFKVWVP